MRSYEEAVVVVCFFFVCFCSFFVFLFKKDL